MTKTISYLPVILFVQLFAQADSLYGQEIFTGIVVDSATLKGIPSVNIQIKTTSRGTRTDDNGSFTIDASRNDTLVFTAVGYERLELSMHNYEAGMVRLSEKYTMLEAVTIDEYRRQDLYEGMFEEQNARRQRNIPFYFSKAKKEKIKVQILKEENLRVQTYVDVVINNPELKLRLIKEHSLTELEYYDILRAFNETHHEIMYYLTRSELISMLNTFFDNHARFR